MGVVVDDVVVCHKWCDHFIPQIGACVQYKLLLFLHENVHFIETNESKSYFTDGRLRTPRWEPLIILPPRFFYKQVSWVFITFVDHHHVDQAMTRAVIGGHLGWSCSRCWLVTRPSAQRRLRRLIERWPRITILRLLCLMPTLHVSKDWIQIQIQIIESGKFYWWNGSKIRVDCSDCLRCSCSRSWGCNLNQFEHQTNGIFIDAKVFKCKNNGEQCPLKTKVSIFQLHKLIECWTL